MLYDRLANRQLSLAVVIDCLEFRSVADALTKSHVLTDEECRFAFRLAVGGCHEMEINRYVVDVLARKRVKLKKKFLDVLAKCHPLLWYYSRRVWCCPERE